jgi:hypothetical protein
MDVGEFFKAFGQSKIPSLLLLLLIYGSGVLLIINSSKDQGIFAVGCLVLLVGAILSIISYGDYRNKEHYDGLLRYYQTALENISRTHTTIEENSQITMANRSNANTVGASGEYTATPISGTDTK